MTFTSTIWLFSVGCKQKKEHKKAMEKEGRKKWKNKLLIDLETPKTQHKKLEMITVQTTNIGI